MITEHRESNSANRVSPRALTRISTGRFGDIPTLWPDRMMMKMKVPTSPNTVTINTGYTAAQLVYSVNVATGNTPPFPGYNEMAQMYGYYKVHACNIKATIVPVSTVGQGSIALVTYTGQNPSSSTVSYGSLLASVGDPFTVWTMLPVVPNKTKTMEDYVSFKKLLGSQVYTTDENYAAKVGQVPLKPLYGLVAIGVPTAVSSNVSYTVVVELEYFIEFYGRQFELQ